MDPAILRVLILSGTFLLQAVTILGQTEDTLPLKGSRKYSSNAFNSSQPRAKPDIRQTTNNIESEFRGDLVAARGARNGTNDASTETALKGSAIIEGKSNKIKSAVSKNNNTIKASKDQFVTSGDYSGNSTDHRTKLNPTETTNAGSKLGDEAIPKVQNTKVTASGIVSGTGDVSDPHERFGSKNESTADTTPTTSVPNLVKKVTTDSQNESLTESPQKDVTVAATTATTATTTATTTTLATSFSSTATTILPKAAKNQTSSRPISKATHRLPTGSPSTTVSSTQPPKTRITMNNRIESTTRELATTSKPKVTEKKTRSSRCRNRISGLTCQLLSRRYPGYDLCKVLDVMRSNCRKFCKLCGHKIQKPRRSKNRTTYKESRRRERKPRARRPVCKDFSRIFCKRFRVHCDEDSSNGKKMRAFCRVSCKQC